MYSYQERNLLPSSPYTGEHLAANFIVELAENNSDLEVQVFRYDRHSQSYLFREKIAISDNGSPSNLRNLLRQNAIFLLSTKQTKELSHLLEFYSMDEAEVVPYSGIHELFPAPMVINESMFSTNEQILLAILHDGTPIYVIQRT